MVHTFTRPCFHWSWNGTCWGA